MDQMLPMIVSERRDDEYVRLPHIEFACSSFVTPSIGLAPVDVDTSRPDCLFLPAFEYRYA